MELELKLKNNVDIDENINSSTDCNTTIFKLN